MCNQSVIFFLSLFCLFLVFLFFSFFLFFSLFFLFFSLFSSFFLFFPLFSSFFLFFSPSLCSCRLLSIRGALFFSLFSLFSLFFSFFLFFSLFPLFSLFFLFVPLFLSCVLAEVLVSLWGLNMEHMCQNTGRDQCHVVNVPPRAQIVVKSSCFQFRCLDPVYGSEAMGRDHKRARTQPREQMMLNPMMMNPAMMMNPMLAGMGSMMQPPPQRGQAQAEESSSSDEGQGQSAPASSAAPTIPKTGGEAVVPPVTLLMALPVSCEKTWGRSVSMLRQVPRNRLAMCLNSICLDLDPTATSNLSIVGLLGLLWLWCRLRPNLRVCDLGHLDLHGVSNMVFVATAMFTLISLSFCNLLAKVVRHTRSLLRSS